MNKIHKALNTIHKSFIQFCSFLLLTTNSCDDEQKSNITFYCKCFQLTKYGWNHHQHQHPNHLPEKKEREKVMRWVCVPNKNKIFECVLLWFGSVCFIHICIIDAYEYLKKAIVYLPSFIENERGKKRLKMVWNCQWRQKMDQTIWQNSRCDWNIVQRGTFILLSSDFELREW